MNDAAVWWHTIPVTVLRRRKDGDTVEILADAVNQFRVIAEAPHASTPAGVRKGATGTVDGKHLHLDTGDVVPLSNFEITFYRDERVLELEYGLQAVFEAQGKKVLQCLVRPPVVVITFATGEGQDPRTFTIPMPSLESPPN